MSRTHRELLGESSRDDADARGEHSYPDQQVGTEPVAVPAGDAPMKKGELPSTLKRSPAKAQRTFKKTHDSAVEEYGEGERAHRTAYASLQHSFEKVDDYWEPKDEPGPSDPGSTRSTPEKLRGEGETFGGVGYYGQSKAELYDRAKELDISGRSKMSKREPRARHRPRAVTHS